MYTAFLILLPIASLIGWFFGRRMHDTPLPTFSTTLHPNYFKGLNYLINEQPDKAVDAFIELLTVDSHTMETHLALGSLFRRRGEVDRAIRIHQNIIARPQLDSKQRVQALLELGKDYLRAGVLDRAERIFLELVEVGEESQASLNFLMEIYELQKDWPQCIRTATRIQALSAENLSVNIAQYYCEQALILIKKNNSEQARRELKRALSVDKNCVRASIMLGEIAIDASDYATAIRCFQRVRYQDPASICLIISDTVLCYKRLRQIPQCLQFLNDCLAENPSVNVMLAICELLQLQEGDRAAMAFLTEHLTEVPTLQGLDQLLHLYLKNSSEDAKQKMTHLMQTVTGLLEDQHNHRCNECGLGSSEMYWHCPGCKQWNSFRPSKHSRSTMPLSLALN